jgi:hypothetical protein
VLFAFGSAILIGVLILASIVVLIAVFIAFSIAGFDGRSDCWEREKERERGKTDCQNHTVCACGGRSSRSSRG